MTSPDNPPDDSVSSISGTNEVDDEPTPDEVVAAHELSGDELAKAVILAESVERTEHPEETGAASSQTIPEIQE